MAVRTKNKSAREDPATAAAKLALLTKELALGGDLRSFAWHILGKRPAPHHDIIYSALADQSRRVVSIVTPTDHAKTTCVSAYLLHEIARNNEHTIAYVSHKDDEAAKTSLLLRDTISGAESGMGQRFRELVDSPDSVYRATKPGKKWVETFWFVNRAQGGKDPTFQCSGDGIDILGARISLGVLDDVNAPKNVATKELMAKLNDKINKTFLTRIRPRESDWPDGGRVVDIRTRWDLDDSLSALMKRFPDMTIVHMPAVGYWHLLVTEILYGTARDIYPAWMNTYIPPELDVNYVESLSKVLDKVERQYPGDDHDLDVGVRECKGEFLDVCRRPLQINVLDRMIAGLRDCRC